MAQGWPSDKESGAKGETVKLKDGEKALLHVLAPLPWSVRQVYNRTAKQSVTLPDGHARVLGEKTSFVFPVFNLTTKTVQVWYTSKKTAVQIKGAAEEYGGMEKMDLSVKRTGSGFDDTVYTITAKPTQFSDALMEGQAKPDMTKITGPTDETKLKEFLQMSNPDAEAREAARLKEPATANQAKYIGDLVDRSKISKTDFAHVLEHAGAKAEAGEFVPKKLTYGQASKLIEQLKDYKPA